jgi:hypothetical protein
MVTNQLHVATLRSLIVTLCLMGCGPSDREIELEDEASELQLRVVELESQLSDADASLDDLSDAVEALENSVFTAEGIVGDFATVDWRRNVPEVEAAVIEIQGETETVRAKVAALRRALNR